FAIGEIAAHLGDHLALLGLVNGVDQRHGGHYRESPAPMPASPPLNGGLFRYTAPMLFDLHCHTTASDGELSPGELLARAASQGVSHLAITDHDSVAAYGDIADPGGLTLIPGVEFSTTWGRDR